MTKYIQGLYKPDNPGKYVGNKDQIVFRSSWELKLMQRFDSDPNIIQWNSEGVRIPYNDLARNKLRVYHVDFWIKKANGEQIIIEVKPYAETKPPVQEKKTKKRFVQECLTFATNSSKWRAARVWAAEKNMKFVIITEKDLMLSR